MGNQCPAPHDGAARVPMKFAQDSRNQTLFTSYFLSLDELAGVFHHLFRFHAEG